ncbi:MAG: hypothetical protein RR945_03220 [Erysipelotrichaceae bacterium]
MENKITITSVNDKIIVQDELDVFTISRNNGEVLINHNEVVINREDLRKLATGYMLVECDINNNEINHVVNDIKYEGEVSNDATTFTCIKTCTYSLSGSAMTWAGLVADLLACFAGVAIGIIYTIVSFLLGHATASVDSMKIKQMRSTSKLTSGTYKGKYQYYTSVGLYTKSGSQICATSHSTFYDTATNKVTFKCL